MARTNLQRLGFRTSFPESCRCQPQGRPLSDLGPGNLKSFLKDTCKFWPLPARSTGSQTLNDQVRILVNRRIRRICIPISQLAAVGLESFGCCLQVSRSSMSYTCIAHEKPICKPPCVTYAHMDFRGTMCENILSESRAVLSQVQTLWQERTSDSCQHLGFIAPLVEVQPISTAGTLHGQNPHMSHGN